MQSHQDTDFMTADETIEEKADRLTRQRLNLITGGQRGEKPLYEDFIGSTLVRRLPDDPHCNRISIGGGGVLSNHGQYVVYRGRPSEIIELLKRALKAVKVAT